MINSNAIIEIKKKNILYNFNLLSKIANRSITAATIKANAYGLGDIEVFKILYKSGCKHFFLATTEEAIRIRRVNNLAKLYVLNGIESNKLRVFKKYNLIPILNSNEEINTLIKSSYFKKNFKFGIHLETGLNRLSVNLKDLNKKIFNKFDLHILISHLSSPDELRNKYNSIQNSNFIRSFNFFKSIKYKSLCSSAGIMNSKKFHHNLTRPGISIYGCVDNIKLSKKYRLKPVIILKGKILQIKKININEYVGYNQTYKTNKEIKVAIIGMGYADGISRKLSNNGKFFFKKDSYKIIGRVSMDSITVDITNSKYRIKVGQYMDLINYNFTADKMAQKYATISNEILTSISKRVKRVYI